MDEKKPLIYRVGTNVKTPGTGALQVIQDDLKAFAALPKSMQDELSRPFPKWVADAMLTDLRGLFPRGPGEIMAGVSAAAHQASQMDEIQAHYMEQAFLLPPPEEFAVWQERQNAASQMAEQSIAHYQQMVEAEAILGIDRNKPETVEPWYFMPESMVLQEAKRLKGVQQQARQLTERGTLTLILRSLDDLPESAEDEVMAYLQRRGAIKKLLTPRGRGNRPNQQYVAAFERVYILKTHSLLSAFGAMLVEGRITPLDESDRADRWNAFTQAMKRLKRKFSH